VNVRRDVAESQLCGKYYSSVSSRRRGDRKREASCLPSSGHCNVPPRRRCARRSHSSRCAQLAESANLEEVVGAWRQAANGYGCSRAGKSGRCPCRGRAAAGRRRGVTYVVRSGARLSLDRLERGRLISSRPEEDTPKGDQPYLLFTVTAEGKRMLSEVRAGAKQLIDALEDFA